MFNNMCCKIISLKDYLQVNKQNIFIKTFRYNIHPKNEFVDDKKQLNRDSAKDFY